MRIATRGIVVAAGVLGLIGTASAANLSGAEIKTLLSGNTIYLATTAASSSGQAGHGVLYFAADGTALFKTPAGAMMHGTWQIKDNSNCTEWKERPGTGCVHYDKAGTVISVVDVASGQSRGTIEKTAPGNPEKLTP